MPVSPNTARLKLLLKNNTMTKMTVTTLTASATSTTGIQTHVNSSGAYVKGLNTVVKNVAWAESMSGSIQSGAIYIPKNGIIKDISVVVTSALSSSVAGTLGVIAGTSTTNLTTPAGGEIIAGDADSLMTSATTLARGKGTSTVSHLTTAYGGAAALVLKADGQTYDSAGELHVWVTGSGGNTAPFATGSVSFITAFWYMGDTV